MSRTQETFPTPSRSERLTQALLDTKRGQPLAAVHIDDLLQLIAEFDRAKVVERTLGRRKTK